MQHEIFDREYDVGDLGRSKRMWGVFAIQSEWWWWDARYQSLDPENAAHHPLFLCSLSLPDSTGRAPTLVFTRSAICYPHSLEFSCVLENDNCIQYLVAWEVFDSRTYITTIPRVHHTWASLSFPPNLTHFVCYYEPISLHVFLSTHHSVIIVSYWQMPACHCPSPLYRRDRRAILRQGHTLRRLGFTSGPLAIRGIENREYKDPSKGYWFQVTPRFEDPVGLLDIKAYPDLLEPQRSVHFAPDLTAFWIPLK